MLEAQQDYSCLGLLSAILGVKGVRVVDGVLGGFFAYGSGRVLKARCSATNAASAAMVAIGLLK